MPETHARTREGVRHLHESGRNTIARPIRQHLPLVGGHIGGRRWGMGSHVAGQQFSQMACFRHDDPFLASTSARSAAAFPSGSDAEATAFTSSRVSRAFSRRRPSSSRTY